MAAIPPPAEGLSGLSPAARALLAQRADRPGTSASALSSIPRRIGALEAPLSSRQQQVWFFEQFEPGSAVYHLPKELRLRGRLDAGALERALAAVVARHEILRTRFAAGADGALRQHVLPACGLTLPIVDMTDSAEVAAAAWRSQAEADALRPFDLSGGEVMRARLYRFGPEDHLLHLVFHHIAFDGWSTTVFLRDLAAAYRTALRGATTLTTLPIQYGDFAAWEIDLLESGRYQDEVGYWREKLRGAPVESTVPTARSRPVQRTYAAAQERLLLKPRLAQALRDLGQSEDATVSMVLLSAFELLLARHSGADDLVVGVPFAGRTRSEQEELVGYFVNMLALRTEFRGVHSFRQLLQQVRNVSLEAFAHQSVPFDRVVADLRPPRIAGTSPVFQVAFNYRNLPEAAPAFEALEVEARAGFHSRSLFDLMLEVTPLANGLECVLTFASELFAAPYARRFLSQFETVLAAIIADPDILIARAPLLRPAELACLIEAGRGPRMAIPDSCVHSLVEEQALRDPGAAAVVDDRTQLTYGELNRLADELAAQLQGAGVGPETTVGVFVDRSPEQIVALLGILKAGGAYVPLDPAYPPDRLAFIAADSLMAAVVTTRALLPRLPLATGAVAVVCLDAAAEDPSSRCAMWTSRPTGSPDQLAYIIYTSGSTGTPKGVEVTHRSVVNLIMAERAVYDVRNSDRVLQFTSINFDVSVSEIFATLAAGAAVVLCTPPMLESVPRFLQSCATRGVTLLSLNTAFWHELVGSLEADALEIPAPVRVVVIGSEAARPDRLALWRRNVRGLPLFNEYGPTETTVFSTAQDLTTAVAGEAGTVPIGYPFLNTDLYVLDDHLEATPPGVPGELFIGGAGLARGYRNRPDLTAERFVPNPFSPDPAERVYRTGDIVRLREDGALDFLGRKDNQVKIRGFRIEPGEIEAVLGRHESVRETAVVAEQDGSGDTRLVAYVVPAGAGFDQREVRGHLRRFLPEYMMPAAFVQLPVLPVLPNGKIDRRGLPSAEPSITSRYTPPRGHLETVLCGIWEDVLAVRPIGRDTDFFELGGHSLAALRVIGRAEAALASELPVRALFEHPTIARLAEHLEHRGDGGTAPPLPPIAADADMPAPLSFAQRRLWFLDRLTPGHATYNLPYAFRLGGMLDVQSLSEAFQRIVERHDPLRMRVSERGAEPVQVWADEARFELPAEELTPSPDDRDGQLFRRLHEEAQRPFDLRLEGPFRARLFRLAEREHVLFLCVHHIATDGWSEDILLRELEALYGAPADAAAMLPELSVGYGAFATWQRRYEGLLGAGLQRWVKRLGNASALELPTDGPRPVIPRQRGDQCWGLLGQELIGDVSELAGREGCTLHMVLLGAFHVLLSRLTGQDDIIIGTPVAGRVRPELEPLIGLFANNLPIRVDLGGEPSFAEVLRRVRAATLTAYGDQAVPLEAMVEACGVARTGAVSALTQLAFALEPEDRRTPRLAGLVVDQLALRTATAKFDLFLAAIPAADGLQLRLEYDVDLFRQDSAARMLELYQRLVAAAVRDPARSIGELDLSSAEEERLLREWNSTERPFPERSIHELFSSVAAGAPDAIAVQEGREQLTYAALEAHSDALASRLAAAGVTAGDRVGVCLDRGAALVVAFLGILKAGGCYVPLDPALPRQRLALMLSDAGIQLVVTAGTAPAALRDGSARLLDVGPVQPTDQLDTRELRTAVGKPGDLAYVMYTSGSTGQPKGVAISHRAVVRLVRNTDYVDLQPDDVVAQASTAAFDAATFEIWGALLNGARLEILPHALLLAADELEDYLRKRGVTTLFLTTALFNQVARARPTAFGSLRQLLFGGETADADAARRVLESESPPDRLINVYGPTENTTFSTWHVVRRVPPGATTLPIGRPIANSTAWVLDARGRQQPVGVWGELYLGGAGVAHGYLGRPAEDPDDRFHPDPFSTRPAQRLFRTGDRARWHLDGHLEFGGRLDAQVKLRGFRIEPAEVEHALQRCQGVQAAAVVVQGDGPARRLVGYLVGPGDLDTARVRDELRVLLPPYMIPSNLVVLDHLPITANGKLDRRGLPALATTGRPAAERPPLNNVERQIASIWQALLGLESIAAGDNFFELGGHSLLALEMIERIEAVTGRRLGVRVLFEEPTLARLARALPLAELSADSPIVELRRGDPGVAPFFYFHGDYDGAGLYTRNLVREFDEAQPVYIVHPHRPGGPTTIEGMAEDLIHAVRRVRPHGPYLLGGFCNGGVVAFEVAQLLRAAAEPVDLLVLMDVPSRNVGVAPYAAFLERVGHILRVPPPRRRALFRATRGSARRLLDDWTSAAEAGSAVRIRTKRAVAVTAWAVDSARRAAARLLAALRRQSAAMAVPTLGPDRTRLERTRYYLEAMEDYVPKRYSGRLVLITPAEEGAVPSPTPSEHWARIAPAAEIRSVSGDHSILTDTGQELSRIMGDLLRSSRRAAQGREGP